jgi:inorganic pyrophosphatase
MNLDRVDPGFNVPKEINVIIEIPALGQPVKYELDKATGAMMVDRFMTTTMFYPCNYGYVPQTLSEDGDPVDVLVITPCPLLTGTVITCRPVGVLNMIDEKGPDAKLLAVPLRSQSDAYHTIKSVNDVFPPLLASIQHFFEHYKDLEEGKWVRVNGWSGVEKAQQEILESIERYKD